MSIRNPARNLSWSVALAVVLAESAVAEPANADAIRSVVDAEIEAVMEEYGIPGVAVAVLARDERYYFNYGVTSPDGGEPVSEETIFEIGSISKTFAATLAAYAEVSGHVDFSDTSAEHMPELADSPIGEVTLEDLGTYAAGGLPLQFPGEVDSQDGMITYFRNWQPEDEAGTQRLYSNPSIGLFGYLAASAMDRDFTEAIEDDLLPAFGLENTFIEIPEDRMDRYAWGMTKDGRKRRVSPGMFDAEAYGIKTTSGDLLRFVDTIMGGGDIGADWRQAIETTLEPRYRAAATIQNLGWESYPFPTPLEVLTDGNSTEMALEPTPIEPAQNHAAVLVNKTGSTSGFGAYAAFVPTEKIGVVILANRNYPNAARVEAAHAILTAME